MPPGEPQGNLARIFGPGGFRAGQQPPQRGPIEDPADAFLAVLRGAGYQPGHINSDGAIHRCPDPDDKPNGDAGWYWLRRDAGKRGRSVACYGTWRLGGYNVWVHGASNGDARLSAEEQAEVDALLREQREQREAEAAESHERAAGHAAERLRECKPASADHPYLVAKGVGAHGIYQLGQTLLIPRMTLDGQLWSLQMIGVDGTKRYQAGAKAGGTCLPIGAFDNTTHIALTEGYATGATVHEATSWPVLVCFDAGNLTAIAKAARAKYSAARIVVCADDDAHLEPNPGLMKAHAAAEAVSGVVAAPKGLDASAGESDWNDLAARIGLEATASQIKEQAVPARLPIWQLGESLSETPQPLSWAVDNWLLRGYLNLVAADGGTGKTTAFQQLGTCIATGRAWLGQSVRPGPVLLVLCEDDRAAIIRRQQTIDKYLGLKRKEYVYPVHVLSRLADSNFLAVRESKTGEWRVTELFQQLLATCIEIEPVAVVLDSLSDFFPGNEIDRAEVSNFVSLTFARLASECNTALVVLAHTPKAPATGKAATYSGSTAWNNKARVRLSLALEEGSSDRLSLKVEKSNYGPSGAALHLRRFGGVIMPADEHPEATFSRDDPSYAQSDDGRCEDAFMELMRIAAERGERVSAKAMANNYGPRMFMRHYQKSAGYAFTKHQYTHAMDQLIKAGKLEVTDVEHDRKPFRVVQIVQQSAPWKDEK